MDQRQTFPNLKSLRSILNEMILKGEKASFLLDRNGLSRAEGSILSMEETQPVGDTVIKLNNDDLVYLKEIVGVNGIFRSDYTEC
ncbi:MAG: hypothetical protein ACTHJ5_12215 [Ilyomonas sp.]